MSDDFPDRPDHPDFWALAAIVQDNDAQMDAGVPVEDVIARYVDPDTVVYMAQQRIQRMLAPEIPGMLVEVIQTAAMAAWIDAFVAAVQFQREKDTQAKTEDSLD